MLETADVATPVIVPSALVEQVARYQSPADVESIRRAFEFARDAHEGQFRESGDPYITHPLAVAETIAELQLDTGTIEAALLHDVAEDTAVTIQDIETRFGGEVARLVDGVTKLSKVPWFHENGDVVEQPADKQTIWAESMRKMFLAMADDIRVVLIKLADRLHNMRTLHFIPSPEKRRRIARETMDIYAPLAERIGMYEFMREMQLLAFRELEPDAYETITGQLEKLTRGGVDRVDRIVEELRVLLAAHGLSAEIIGRTKHPYSVWRKMQERHVSFEQVTDIIAFRVITGSTEDCYRALGIIHGKWKMVPGRFKDFISTPKRNGYQSLHTTIMRGENMRVEIQIRSRAMHQQGEFGLAAHWAYKQGSLPDGQAGWIRDLVEILEQADDAEELLEHTRMAMYQDRIFAFSPKGALHQLPKGATPVDFAYAVHTGLGDKTVGAKVNGRLVPLRTQLRNGDTVQILTSEKQHPEPSWMGFVVTGKARAAIRRHVRHTEREETVALGRKLFDEIVARLPVKIGDKAIKAALGRLRMETQNDLLFAIGKQRLQDSEVMEALVPGVVAELKRAGIRIDSSRPISIEGLTPGVAYDLAACCHPVPGDRIVGISRPGQGIEIHTIDCDKLADGEDADWIDVRWTEDSEGGTARLVIVIPNQPGTLHEMTGLIARQDANIVNLRLQSREGGFHAFEIDLEVRDVPHLMSLLSTLRASETVVSADRI